MYTYLIINLLSMLPVVYLSFDKRLDFYKSWKYLFPSIILTMAFFIPWDILYTEIGIWGFNPLYITDLYVLALPIEEWMFFIAIPFACVFTYEVMGYYFGRDDKKKLSIIVSLVLIPLLLYIGVSHYDRWYTSFTFVLTAIFIGVHQFHWRSEYLGRFYLSYAFILVPFLIVNGILTGTGLEEEVVWYDNSQNLGIRILTIPIEDTVYGLLLVLMNVTYYEKLKRLY